MRALWIVSLLTFIQHSEAKLVPHGTAEYETWTFLWSDNMSFTLRRFSDGPQSGFAEEFANHRYHWDDDDATDNVAKGRVDFSNQNDEVNRIGTFSCSYETFAQGGNDGGDDRTAGIELKLTGTISFTVQPTSPPEFFPSFLFAQATHRHWAKGNTSHTSYLNSEDVWVEGGNTYGGIESKLSEFEGHQFEGLLAFDVYPNIKFAINHSVSHGQACCVADSNHGTAEIRYAIIEPSSCTSAQEHVLPTQNDLNAIPDWTKSPEPFDDPGVGLSTKLDLKAAVSNLFCMKSAPRQMTPEELLRYPLAASWSSRGVSVYPRIDYLERYLMQFKKMPTLALIAAHGLESFWRSSFHDFAGILSTQAKFTHELAETLVGDQGASMLNFLQELAGYVHRKEKQKELLKHMTILVQDSGDDPLSAMSYLKRLIEDPGNISFEDLDDAIMATLILGADARDQSSILSVESAMMNAYGDPFQEEYQEEGTE